MSTTEATPQSHIFDHKNANGARVWDIDTKSELRQVMSINTQTGEVVCAEMPLRVFADEVATFAVRYRTISPIYGGMPKPCLFHCYGKEAQP